MDKEKIMARYKQIKNEVLWSKIVNICKEERQIAKLSQAEVSEVCKCSQTLISLFERGLCNNGYLLGCYLFVLPLNCERIQNRIGNVIEVGILNSIK